MTSEEEVAKLRVKVDGLSERMASTQTKLAVAQWFGAAIGAILLGTIIYGQIAVNQASDAASEASDLATSAEGRALAAEVVSDDALATANNATRIAFGAGRVSDIALGNATRALEDSIQASAGAASVQLQISGIDRQLTSIQERAGLVATDLINLSETEGIALDAVLTAAAPYLEEQAAQFVQTGFGLTAGMIMAFDLVTGCPEGWQTYEIGAGRFILGAGQGDGLTERQYGAVEGEERVLLTVDTMPTHSHDYGGQRAQYWIRDMDEEQSAGPAEGGGHFQPVYRVSPQGGDQPHNNMPPYIALHFCEYVGVGAD